MLICNDWDLEALDVARERLTSHAGRIAFTGMNFAELPAVLKASPLYGGVLLDLGMSQLHIDSAARGFSFKRDGPLDMRMDQRSGVTAYDILASLGERELESIFREYGEEPLARKIAGELCILRSKGKLPDTTRALADVVFRVYKGKTSAREPATRVFQSLRIAVNRELANLETAICRYINWMPPDAKLVIISYHSVEDRIVKRTFRNNKDVVDILTKKPVVPSHGEVKLNRKARSAKLRACIKL